MARARPIVVTGATGSSAGRSSPPSSPRLSAVWLRLVSDADGRAGARRGPPAPGLVGALHGLAEEHLGVGGPRPARDGRGTRKRRRETRSLTRRDRSKN